jgi:TetR/AcrR family transcriptional repressor of nem operon
VEAEMRVSREQVAENRRKILDAAGRLFRERGYDAVTVADVMKAAGLTHGGFYGYFASKDELIARTLAHVLAADTTAGRDLATFAATYLTPRHRDDRAGGCAVAALGAETVRQGPEARSAMTDGLRHQIERLSRTAPGDTEAERRRAAIGSWAAMVGAVVLARLSDDPRLADEVLAETRGWIRGEDAPRARRA